MSSYKFLRKIWVSYFLYNKLLMTIIKFINKVRFPKLDLTIILWPPAYEIFDEICEEIKNRQIILNSYDIKIRQDDFNLFLNEIYKLDYGSLNKITNKVKFVGVQPYIVRVLKIRFNRPTIEVQDILNRKKCKDVNYLKQYIRGLFANKIQNYKYDMIIHSTETEKQGNKAEKIIKNFGDFNV